MWFAFKLYLYRVLSHRETNNPPGLVSCDLLSNCIFIEFYHICTIAKDCSNIVVICFQIVSLSSSITSKMKTYTDQQLLWFAFKLYLYRVLSHHNWRELAALVCCDLLSNCIFIEFYHIVSQVNKDYQLVVICFQIVSLSSSITSLVLSILLL